MRNLIVVAVISVLALSPESFAQSRRKATAIELTAMPQFCWSQFSDSAKGPQFSLPPKSVCGSGTNHYCYGLLALHRAKVNKSDPPKHREVNLRRAKSDTLYTAKAIERYPTCPLRNHVRSTLTEIETLERVYVR